MAEGAPFENRGSPSRTAADSATGSAERVLDPDPHATSYRFLFEQIGQGVVFQDAEGRILSANPAAEQILGLTLAQMQGRTSHDPRWRAIREDGSEFPGDEHPSMVALRTGRPVSDVVMGVFHPAEEDYRWLLVSAVPRFREGEVRPYQVFTSFSDITRLRRARQQTMELMLRQQALLAAVPDIVAEVDVNRVYTWMNEAGLAFFGDDAIGREAASYFEGEQTTYQTVRPLFNGVEDVIYVESWQRRRDGQKRLLAWWCRVLKDAEGRVTGALSTARDITDVQQAQERLRDSEETFSKAFHLSPVTMVILSAEEGRYVDVNNAFVSLVGYTRDEAIGRTSLELGLWLDVRARDRVWSELAAAGEVHNVPVQLRTKSGEIRDVLYSAARITLHGVPHVIAQGLDITEHKRAEEALRRSEERFRSLYANMAEGVALHDVVFDDRGVPVNYRITAINAQYEQMTGLTAGQVVGRLATEAYETPEPPYREEFTRVALTGVPYQFETYFPPMDRYFRISVAPLENRGFATIFFDITARKRADQERARLTAILESTSDLVASAGVDGRVTYMNDAGRRMVGWSHDEDVSRRRIPEIHPAWAYELIRQEGIPTAIEKGVWRGETAILGRDGRNVPVSQVIMAHRSPEGELLYLSTIMRDITERKQAETERERLLRELEAKNEELESLLYAASHDLRAPLVNIQGFAQRLDESCARLNALLSRPEAVTLREDVSPVTDKVIPASLGFIRTSADKMSVLIDGMLRICRLGRAALNVRDLDMDRLLGAVLASMEYQVKAAGATVRIEALPACRADEGQVNQVFTNLLDNALKYRHPSRPPEIRVSGRIDGGRVVYCVEDNGAGIAREHQNKIWELFHRLDPRGSVAGEGLGLTLVRRIVERHGGKVWVHSTAGQGSQFYVALPAATTAGP